MRKDKRRIQLKKIFDTDNETKEYDGGEPELEEYQQEPQKWFHQFAKEALSCDPVTQQVLLDLKEEAKKCHELEVTNYNSKNMKNNSNQKWLKTAMYKGTISDKVAAHVVSIQENPICNLDNLKNLVGMIKTAKKKECLTAIDALTELLISDLLPKRALRKFGENPLSKLDELSSGNAITRRKLLSAWYFEDQLKELYASYITALNNVAHDSVDSNKEKAVGALYKLLEGNEEQEKILLSNIVNKLGDPSQKSASKAIYCLGQLLRKKPKKQEIVLNEVEKLLFRSNISTRAQYYGLCLLSQFYLTHKASEIATKLIDVYFAFFKACIKKGDVDSRMMPALLMGVNRAYPYANLEKIHMSEHIDTMYRVVHIANFNVSLHALNLLFQVSNTENNITDRFYSALYKKLLDTRITTSTHQAMLLALVFKALMKDKEVSRVKVFIKRLLQASQHSQPNFACGVLFMLSQMLRKKRGLHSFKLNGSGEGNVFIEAKIEVDEEEAGSSDEGNRVKEDGLDVKLNVTTMQPKTDDVDEKPEVDSKEVLSGSGTSQENGVVTDVKFKPVTKFNPLGRNPLYCGGEHCFYSELLELKNHFHPTVSLYASNLLEGVNIKYSGDPLKDFTLIRFLDRFVFKNPKKSADAATSGAHPKFGIRKLYRPSGIRSLTVTSNAYINENQKYIPVDEVFMHEYLTRKYRDVQVKEEEDDDSDLDSVKSEEFEEMLHKMGAVKDEDDDFDYMNDIGENLKKKKGKKSEDKSDDEENDEEKESIADEDDEELDNDDTLEDEDEDHNGFDDEEDSNLDDLSEDDQDDDDDDDEVMEFDSDSEGESKPDYKTLKKGIKKRVDNINSLFASADEFATLLEDEGSSKIVPGSSNVFSNQDKANVKQLAWEEKRNQWLQGYSHALGKGKRKTFSNSKHSGKRGFKSDSSNKSQQSVHKNKKRKFK